MTPWFLCGKSFCQLLTGKSKVETRVHYSASRRVHPSIWQFASPLEAYSIYGTVQATVAVLHCLSVAGWRASNGGDGCALCLNDTYDRWQHSLSRAV